MKRVRIVKLNPAYRSVKGERLRPFMDVVLDGVFQDRAVIAKDQSGIKSSDVRVLVGGSPRVVAMRSVIVPGERVEGWGVKGKNGTAWRKTFDTHAELMAWVKKNHAELEGMTEFEVLNPAPEPCGGRKPAESITDRALRYRANSEACRPDLPARCMWCGSRRVEVAHIDGNETNTVRENLGWTCRPCNQKVAANMKRAGVGRPTNQYNPKRGKRKGISDYREFQQALAITRGDEIGDVQAAVEKIHATPMSRRSEFQKDIWAIRKERYGPSGRKDGGALPF